MISLWLRAGGSLKHVIQQLKGIGSSLQIPTKDGRIMSLGDGLARAIMKYQRAKEFFGLEDLLLGRADLSELENNGHELKTRQPESGGTDDGHGGGNGNGGNGKSGNGKRESQRNVLAMAGVSVGSSTRPEVRLGGSSIGMFADSSSANMPTTASTAFKLKCPECGADLVYGEGCVTCQACGWAKC
jgi:hypothetical protein